MGGEAGDILFDLLGEYRSVTNELAGLHRELGMCLRAELEARASMWKDMDATSVSAGERAIAVHTVDLAVDIARIKAEIAAIRERKDYLGQAIGVFTGRT